MHLSHAFDRPTARTRRARFAYEPTDVLIRYGRREHPAVRRGLERVAADLQATNQGSAWTCIPDPGVGFRGPGRKADICPQVTLEALRTFARLPPEERPEG